MRGLRFNSSRVNASCRAPGRRQERRKFPKFPGLGVVAIAFWAGSGWAADALAAVLTGGLLLAIRNEWDLITWITPRGDAEHGEADPG